MEILCKAINPLCKGIMNEILLVLFFTTCAALDKIHGRFGTRAHLEAHA